MKKTRYNKPACRLLAAKGVEVMSGSGSELTFTVNGQGAGVNNIIEPGDGGDAQAKWFEPIAETWNEWSAWDEAE